MSGFVKPGVVGNATPALVGGIPVLGVLASGNGAHAPAAAEEPEPEVDAEEDPRPRLGEAPVFLPEDCSANLVPSDAGGILMGLRDGGLRHLAAGACASVGIRAGRYVVAEARVLEEIAEAATPSSRSFVRVGVAAEGVAPHLLGEDEDSICFSSESLLIHAGQRTRLASSAAAQALAPAWAPGHVLAVVLNVDPGSPNSNTLSLFLNGRRFSKPEPLPDRLRGRALYPAVMFKGASVHVNFGPRQLAPLPFACRMLRDAAKDDVVVRKPRATEGERREVVFPVCLPDEGGFEWLDGFLEEHPHFVELSDRKVAAWAAASGFTKPAAKGPSTLRSMDRACSAFIGATGLEDGSVQRGLGRFAELSPRDLVVMEVQGNLEKETRAASLARFPSSDWRRVAIVAVGEPDEATKARGRAATLQEKQRALDAEHARKVVAEAAKKRAQQAVEKRKLEAEAKESAAKKAKGEKGTPEPKGPVTTGDGKEPAKADAEEPPPKAELTDVEKRAWFRAKGDLPDVAQSRLAGSIGALSLPDGTEGFDEIRYVWSKEEKAQEHLREWIVEKKREMPLEVVPISGWFKQKLETFRKDFARWQAVQKAALAKRSAGKKSGDDQEVEDDEGKSMEPDVFGIDDICGTGDKMPLFLDFDARDWAVLVLRFELHLMVHALMRDCPDPDRKNMTIHQVSIYYSKFYKKVLTPKSYGFDEVEHLVGFLEDTVYINRDTECVEAQIGEDHATNDIFVKLTEESRRHVLRQVLAGDGDCLLPVFPAAVVATPAPFTPFTPLLATKASAAGVAGAPAKATAPQLKRPGDSALRPQGVTAPAAGGAVIAPGKLLKLPVVATPGVTGAVTPGIVKPGAVAAARPLTPGTVTFVRPGKL